ncbi:MAG TPA: aminotransferase class I/II-fold pyridoxal phosphate-dependent enzyme [Thermoleophilaceae bacterium]|jgi:histidinol-phosphate aminotransferase|nr:aminotransferase class I/II-fold pyridoxal phosphate-dependent enzyme [Thermoleophilaceae bacterium]
MGFRDYYRRFEDLDPLELNRALRERRHEERRRALERVPDLDLSGTEWPDLPHSEIVNAAIARARGRVNGYPDRYASGARRLLADRHGVAPEQIALGNGAAELLQSAAMALLNRGDELLMPWPSYPLYPLMAAHACARPVAVDRAALLDSVTPRTRAVVICNPNDPTGEHVTREELGELITALPDGVHVLLDEALVHFQDVEPVDACLRLVDAFPRLLVVRTFSKVYGLSGLRAGYAVSSDTKLLAAIAPVLGVNALSQAAVEHALRTGDAEIERRRGAVARERARLLDGLREMAIDAAPSQANFIWLAADGITGALLAQRLRDQGVIVAPGGPLGADDHVRATVRDEAATDRLVRALEIALG